MNITPFPTFESSQPDADREQVQRIYDQLHDHETISKLIAIREKLAVYVRVAALHLLEEAIRDSDFQRTPVLDSLTEVLRELNHQSAGAEQSLARWRQIERDLDNEKAATGFAAQDLRDQLASRASRLRADIGGAHDKRISHTEALRKAGIRDSETLARVEPSDSTVAAWEAELRDVDKSLARLHEFFSTQGRNRSALDGLELTTYAAHLARISAPLPQGLGPHGFRSVIDPTVDVKSLRLTTPARD
ncbi:hypothetical protein [Burkholderia sp. Bp9031]|uniref:hypothetical protein n=1 Tax=Burkholderia sp. Bp9031 TaxID=2184566 RepID=UPI000F5F97C3|nr:hypothetical protein [Burkholderia sp. Bp9031]